jgi:hypothetical protein
MEQSILFIEGLDRSVRVSRLGLKFHVCIRYFWNGRAKAALSALDYWRETITSDLQEEYGCEEEAEASNGKIDPLYVMQGFLVLSHTDEDGIRSKDWRYNSTNPVEGLGDVDAKLGVSRWAADRDVWICSGFEGAQAVANDENGSAEPAKGLVQDTWPCN